MAAFSAINTYKLFHHNLREGTLKNRTSGIQSHVLYTVHRVFDGLYFYRVAE